VAGLGGAGFLLFIFAGLLKVIGGVVVCHLIHLPGGAVAGGVRCSPYRLSSSWCAGICEGVEGGDLCSRECFIVRTC
jgi:hypothetical protein